MKKIEIPLSRSNRLINYGPVVLVSTQSGGKRNILPIAWVTPISHKPPILCISVSLANYSNKLIKESKEFVVNVPGKELISKVEYCGGVSGKDTDKFKESGLTPVNSKKIKAPTVDECLAHLECKVIDIVEAGDHTIFLGEVLFPSAVSHFLDKDYLVNLKKVNTLHHLGRGEFGSLKEV